MTYSLDDYEGLEIEFNKPEEDFDIQRDAVGWYGTSKIYGRKRISPTAMGNCEKRMVLATIPQTQNWEGWGTMYAEVGKDLEDFVASYYGEGTEQSNIVMSYIAEVIPHLVEEDFGVQKVVYWALRNAITKVLEAQFGVGNLISQDNKINIKGMNVFSYADLFIDIDGEFVIGEVKSLGDMPFNASPYKREEGDEAERLQAIYKKKYIQLKQLEFYMSVLGASGQMVYISRNSQKGNGSRKSPKYLNAANVPVPFIYEEAHQILTRIYFVKACIAKKRIPPTPEHMKPPKGRVTSFKCTFCDYQRHCHKGADLALDTEKFGYELANEEALPDLWKRCERFATISLGNEKDPEFPSVPTLKENRAVVHKHLVDKKGYKGSFEDFLAMFTYTGD